MKQTIKDRSRVIFNVKQWRDEDWEQVGVPNIEEYENKEGIVLQLATFTALGEQDFEYYDVEFPGIGTLYAVSGYHLDVLEKKVPK